MTIVFAFIGGCIVSLKPVWAIAERLRIRDVTVHELTPFPVLVKASSSDSKFAIGSLNDPGSPPPVVSGLSDDVLSRINADLRTLISTNQFAHNYFTITRQELNFVDVALEVPTINDSMTKTWYQIREGRIIPKKWIRYGPGFAFLVMPWTLVAGVLTALTARGVMQRMWPNKAMDRNLHPRHASCVRTCRAEGCGSGHG